LRSAAPLRALFLLEPDMSNNSHDHQAQEGEQDTVESIVHHMPIVLPAGFDSKPKVDVSMSSAEGAAR